jgi:hypothetical protein
VARCRGSPYPSPWGGLSGSFEAGVVKPYADQALEDVFRSSKTSVMKPQHYMDKWRLDRNGVRAVANIAVKKSLGFE